MVDTFTVEHGLPCRNPNCKSFNSIHFGCKCYTGGENHRAGQGEFAKGGSVCSLGLPHHPDCEFYAQGGQVGQRTPSRDDIPNTLGMAGVHHGLLGLLTEVGHSKLADPDHHHQKLHDLRNEPNPEKHPEMMHGHPLSGGTAKAMLKPILERMAGPLQTQEVHPEAARSGIQYLASSMKGEHALDQEMNGLLEKHKKASSFPLDKEGREKLREHLEALQEKPEALLNVGGTLSHYLPEHGAGLAYQSAQALQYFQKLKPTRQQLAPLDTPEPLDKAGMARYDRQLDIAQKPTLILNHLKEGTLQPLDLATVQAIYPGLLKSMINKATAKVIEAKNKDIEIPYKQKMGLSLLIGTPLDFTQTPEAGMAVIGANSTMVAPDQQGAPKKSKGSKKSGITAPELKAIDKADSMELTSLQARQINRNSK